MMIDAWIYAKLAEWNALATGEAPFSYAHSMAVTGFWKSFGAYEVYNVVGTQQEIQDILDALTDVAHVYSWGQGTGFDSFDPWPTDPTNVLAVMRDHVTYDENGNVVSTVPASTSNPNWGHFFLGQTGRIFAGEFNTDFSGDFY